MFENYHNHKEIVNYIFVGALTTLVSLVIYYGCVYTFLDPNQPIQLQIANVISWIGAVLFAYITNRKYVFESHNEALLKEAAAFFAARAATLLIDMASMFIMVTLCAVNDKLAKLVVQIIIVAANYLLSKFFVFRKKQQKLNK